MKFPNLILGTLMTLLAVFLQAAATADLEDRTLLFGREKLAAPSSTSICNLPMKTKGSMKSVRAGRKYKLGITLTNNIAKNLDSIVVKVTLPEGTTYEKASISPPLANRAKTPTLEQDGTKLIWRNIDINAGKKLKFRIMVQVECGAPTPLIFRSYTTVGGTSWITGPEIKVAVKSTKTSCRAFSSEPVVVNESVLTLGSALSVPPGIWTTQPGTINANQAIKALPSSRRLLPQDLQGRTLTASSYDYALRQETLNNPSKATTGVYYEPYGICNGLLFKDFVKGGFHFSYEFWVDSTPAGYEHVYAPDIRIQTRSPATGQYSDFIWNPAANGDTDYQSWEESSMTETSGTTGGWPVGNIGGSGWICTLGCYVPTNTTGTLAYPPSQAYETFRDLETYVDGLESFGTCSSAYIAINDAIITGIQVVLGPDEPNTVAFTRKVRFTTNDGQCNYKWTFGPK